jgi:hypothetical protein
MRRVLAFVEAFDELLWLDLWQPFGYRTLCRFLIARARVRRNRAPYDAVSLVRVAVRDACVFYPKRALCLQRSAVVTRMLRRRGVNAELVIGYQPVPVKFHAWVEVTGRIVWDHLDGIEYFRIVDRY